MAGGFGLVEDEVAVVWLSLLWCRGRCRCRYHGSPRSASATQARKKKVELAIMIIIEGTHAIHAIASSTRAQKGQHCAAQAPT